MVEIFLELICAAMKIGTITEAGMYPNKYISVDGNTSDGCRYSLSFRLIDKSEKDGSDNP